MVTKFIPLYDRILVQRVDEKTKTPGGLFIPDMAQDKPQEGIVISVGQGKFKEDGATVFLQVKAKDRILFGKYSGTEIKLDGEDFIIMREEEVLGIVLNASSAVSAA